MSIRKMIFGGNLMADPEVRQAGENTVCNFTIAASDYRGGAEVTDFIECEAWGKVGQSIAENFKKGSRIFVSGSFGWQRYTTEEGEKRKSFRVRVTDWESGSYKSKETTGAGEGEPVKERE